jgi:ABC-type transporter Mla subunit MlaD
LRGGAVITKTSSPTEVLDVQTDAQGALQQLDAQSLNNFLADLALFTKGKRNEVTTILDGLNRLTGTINERRGQLATLIDSAATVSKTLASRDQTLVQAIDDLEVVVQGLAERRAELTQLLDNTSAAAGQIAGLVGANRTKLDAILAELHTDLAIIGQHQVDLAQSVAYLASGIEGFQSIGYSGPNNYPQPWANVFTVGLGPASADPVFGCGGAVDQALTVAVGPDPLPCSQAVGPVGTSVGVTGAGRALPVGTAATTAASIESLLTPLLVGP